MENKKIDPKQLAVGIEVEKEHTKDPKEAEKIATQHLKEKGNEKYYTKLYKAGVVNEPEAKKLAKKYLVNEHQFQLISENIINEVPLPYGVRDQVILLSPLEGYAIPPQSIGVIKHIDAIGTLTIDFTANGKIIRARTQEKDKLGKYNTTSTI